jgi:hypothetical protein
MPQFQRNEEIEALSVHTSDETLANRIGLGRLRRRPQHYEALMASLLGLSYRSPPQVFRRRRRK